MRRLTYDFTHAFDDVVQSGQGLPADALTSRQADVAEAVRGLEEMMRSGDLTYLTLPDENLDAIEEAAANVRARFTDLVVLGIGGSSLGARAVYTALVRRHTGRHVDGTERAGVRLHFLENVDPVETADLLESLPLDTTAFNVVTKSGTTIETMSSFLVVRERLMQRYGEAGYRERVFVTTDPHVGALRGLARRENLPSFDVPPHVGGRFSVLSAVGLFPLACAGIDVHGLLRGAASARESALDSSLADNPAAVFATLQIAFHDRGMRECVFMPYASCLSGVTEWFVQLWAESLGKLRPGEDGALEGVGPTPIPALGTVDQHSQLQLFVEGPPTRNIVFIEVERTAEDVTVPAPRGACEPLLHLGGKTLGQIMLAELAGVREGLAEAGRPTSTLRLPRVCAENIGALLMFLQCSTAIAGHLLRIDPFNQPGVEIAKRIAHGLLGREKERHYAAQIQASIADRPAREISI